MSVSKVRNSTEVIKPLGMTAVIAALETKIKDGNADQAPVDKAVSDVAPAVELTADTARKYLQAISTSSFDEIDTLISGLRGLRDKLQADGGRIEQGIADFADLNQSVVKLTEVVAHGVAHVQAPSLAE